MSQRKPEQDLSNAIRLAVGSLPDVRLWRNNSGRLIDSRGIPVSFGLAIGSADLIGIVAPHGRMLSIEVKRPGAVNRATAEQRNWADIIAQFGGVAGIVDCVDGAMALVEMARKPRMGT